MSISERLLRKWRKEALKVLADKSEPGRVDNLVLKRQAEQLLQMTQELLDQHLLRK